MSSVPPVNFNMSEVSGNLADAESVAKLKQIDLKFTELLGHWMVSKVKTGTLNKVAKMEEKIKLEEVHRVMQAIKTEGTTPSSSTDSVDSANDEEILARREHDAKTHKILMELLQLLEDLHPHLKTDSTTQEVPNSLAEDLSYAFDDDFEKMFPLDCDTQVDINCEEWPVTNTGGEALAEAGSSHSTNETTVRGKPFSWTLGKKMKLVLGFLQKREKALKNKSKKQPSDIAILKELKKSASDAFPTAEIMRNQLNNIVKKYLETFKIKKRLKEVKANVKQLRKILSFLDSGDLYPSKKCKKRLSGRVKK